MKRFYETKDGSWIIHGFSGFVMLRLMKYPDSFFHVWFFAIPGFAIGAAMGGAASDFSAEWAKNQIVLGGLFILILFLLSMLDSLFLFKRMILDRNTKVIPKTRRL